MLRAMMLGGAVLMVAAGPAGDKPNWMKWDAGKATAAQSGLPILVYSVVDQKGGSC